MQMESNGEQSIGKQSGTTTLKLDISTTKKLFLKVCT
jgi:hypothetical protein